MMESCYRRVMAFLVDRYSIIRSLLYNVKLGPILIQPIRRKKISIIGGINVFLHRKINPSLYYVMVH